MQPDLHALDTPGPFRAHIQGHDSQAIVGTPGCARNCPLACYLRRCGFPRVEVHYTFWVPAPNAEPIPLPTWAVTFIRESKREFCGPLGTRPCTAVVCLALLEGAK